MMATYLMNYWGMDHCVRPNKKKPDQKKHHPLSKVAECGESVTQSQYMSYNQGIVEEMLIKLIYTCILLVTEDKEQWPYFASSGYIRTGRNALEARFKTFGQGLHGDNKNIFLSQCFKQLMLCAPTASLEDMKRLGWIADLCLSEGSRGIRLVLPNAKEKKFEMTVVNNLQGDIIVRHQALLHSGHGGMCGDIAWHCMIMPNEYVKCTNSTELAWLRMLPSYADEFNDWTLDWRNEVEYKQEEDWSKNLSSAEKGETTRYGNTLWSRYASSDVPTMTYTGAVISRFLVSPNGEAAKKALLKVGGQCGKADNPAGAQPGAQQVGNQNKGAETAEDEHNQDNRVDLSVSLESNVYPLWREYPQIKMVRDVQRSYNMTLTPVVPMAAGTGFGTGSSETTTTTPASAAKSKPVEKQKADQDSDEKEATSAPTAPENVAAGRWVKSFAEVRAGLSEEKRARVDEHSEILAEFARMDQRAAQYAQQGNSQQAEQAARSQQAEAVAETNKHVSLLEVGCELSDSEPEKD
jgi:hypothetical protein